MGGTLTALRRRLIPYCLLGPGLLWLILFFVVPMYFMGRLSLESGIARDGLHVRLGLVELHGRAGAYDTPVHPLVQYSAAGDADRAC